MLELRLNDAAGFFDAPYHAYPGDERFVQPLRMDVLKMIDPRRNPLFRNGSPRELWTAYRDHVPVGRLICHVHDASNARFSWRRAYFGMFDCPDDAEVAAELLARAERFAGAQQCDTLVGNVTLTAMQQMGVVTDGFEAEAYVDQQWNPPHIPRLLRQLGFMPEFPMRTFEVDLGTVRLEELEARFLAPARANPSLQWRALQVRQLAARLEDIRTVLNDAFAHNPMFVPLSEEELAFQADGLSHVIDPAITQLVYDDEGPAAVLVCIPDLNPFFRATRSRLSWRTPAAFWRVKHRRDRAIAIFGGVCQRHQGRKLAGALLAVVMRSLIDRGYRTLGITWVSDGNKASLAQMERLGARVLHHSSLFVKSVAP